VSAPSGPTAIQRQIARIAGVFVSEQKAATAEVRDTPRQEPQSIRVQSAHWTYVLIATVGSLLALVLLLAKHRLFIRTYVTVASIGLLLGLYTLAETGIGSVIPYVGLILGKGMWIVYALRSKRIRVTTLHEIPSADKP